MAPRNDYDDASHYYATNSSRDFLHAVPHPTLVVFAQNDPWIPAASYLDYPWHRNPNLVPLLPESGGHVGFHARGDGTPWHDRCIERFAAAVENTGEPMSHAG